MLRTGMSFYVYRSIVSRLSVTISVTISVTMRNQLEKNLFFLILNEVKHLLDVLTTTARGWRKWCIAFFIFSIFQYCLTSASMSASWVAECPSKVLFCRYQVHCQKCVLNAFVLEMLPTKFSITFVQHCDLVQRICAQIRASHMKVHPLA